MFVGGEFACDPHCRSYFDSNLRTYHDQVNLPLSPRSRGMNTCGRVKMLVMDAKQDAVRSPKGGIGTTIVNCVGVPAARRCCFSICRSSGLCRVRTAIIGCICVTVYMAQGELRVVFVVVMIKADERLMKVKEALLCERRTPAKHLQGKTFRAGGRRKISKRTYPLLCIKLLMYRQKLFTCRNKWSTSFPEKYRHLFIFSAFPTSRRRSLRRASE